MVYTVGETVLDIIIETFDNVKIKVGGSMLNTAISVARLGIPVRHVSYLSDDKVSEKVIDYLFENKVDATFVSKNTELKTNLALAFLDENKNADYVFYKNTASTSFELHFPKVAKGDIVLFGSFFSLNPLHRGGLCRFLSEAKAVGAFIIYDPNFRKPHLNQLDELMPYIEENFRFANFVKGSDEDFDHIFKLSEQHAVWKKLQDYGVEHLVYTKGSSGAAYMNQSFEVFTESYEIVPVSTIGAGDTFTAGIIHSMVSKNNAFGNKEKVSDMLDKSHKFSSHVCLSMDNYLSLEFANTYNHVQ